MKIEIARGDSKALRIEAPAGATNAASNYVGLPLEVLRGARVRVEALVKADGVSAPPKPWNGIKVMLHTQSPDGDKWEQQNNVAGTFDWKLDDRALCPTDLTQIKTPTTSVRPALANR